MQGSGVSALMADDLLLDLGALPFSLGPQTAAVNPGGLPTTLPFRLVMDRRTGVLSQQRNERVEQCLESAYRSGSLLGPAMDDTDIGRPYARDFLEFVLRELRPLHGKSLLEIGSGRGYLLKLLGDSGASAIGLEPGMANANYWRKFAVRVVHGMFPKDAPLAAYEAILAYAVLEHIPAPLPFLEQIRQALPPGGRVLLAVPDCEPHIIACDSAMLFHEHFSYFTQKSLRNSDRASGLLGRRDSASGLRWGHLRNRNRAACGSTRATHRRGGVRGDGQALLRFHCRGRLVSTESDFDS